MSDVKWNEPKSDRVSFIDEGSKASESLKESLPASDSLKKANKVKAASLSGADYTASPSSPKVNETLTATEKANKKSKVNKKHGAGNKVRKAVETGAALADEDDAIAQGAASEVRGAIQVTTAVEDGLKFGAWTGKKSAAIVHGAKNFIQTVRTSDSNVSVTPSAQRNQATSPSTHQDPAVTPSTTEIPSSHSSRTSGGKSGTKSKESKKHGSGTLLNAGNKVREAVETGAAFAGEDDAIAQGAASEVRGVVKAATAVDDGLKFGAWTWKKSAAIVHGTKDFIQAVRTEGLWTAIKNVIKVTAAAIGTALSPILIAASVALVFVAIITVVISVFDIGTDMSLGTSTDNALDELYEYCTELDAELTAQIHQMLDTTGYDEVRLNINGGLTTAGSEFQIKTNINQLLIYLQVANSDGSHTVEEIKAQIDEIYSAVYGLDTSETSETVTETTVIHAGESLGRVVTSAYCSCAICCGQWAGGPTASGVKPQAEHTLAVDAYNPIVPIGTAVVIEGVLYRVEDTGNLNAHGVDFDVYHDTHTAALAWGHRTLEAYLAGNEGDELEVSTTKTKHIFNVNLATTSLQQYISERMTDEMQEHVDLINLFGVYAGYATANNPFGDGQHWTVTDRFGSYADGTTVTSRNYISVSTSSGREIYSPITGVISWSGSTAQIMNTSNSGKRQIITISGVDSVIGKSSKSISSGTLIGTASGTNVKITYLIGDTYVNPVIYLANEPGSSSGEAIIEVALSQLGQRGGEPYWRFFGKTSREEWCSEFVSWCANECGYLDAGLVPKYSYSGAGIRWFQERGLWQNGGYAPSTGDVIFFDWDGDGESDHTGLVMDCNGTTVYTVEGNSGDAVRQRTYSINDHRIIGYGTPAYS